MASIHSTIDRIRRKSRMLGRYRTPRRRSPPPQIPHRREMELGVFGGGRGLPTNQDTRPPPIPNFKFAIAQLRAPMKTCFPCREFRGAPLGSPRGRALFEEMERRAMSTRPRLPPRRVERCVFLNTANPPARESERIRSSSRGPPALSLPYSLEALGAHYIDSDNY